ncbi:MAG: hypothetical protein GKR89_33185 [Candidatus Latescibacteria bacterium]|nr:hypothetical protein [Candidatus Latescibacterota bacterium]
MADALQEANNIYRTRILVDQATMELSREAMELRCIDRLRLDDQSPICAYELLARKGELDAQTAHLRDLFQEGLEAYWQQDWEGARGRFTACLDIRDDDGPAQVFLGRHIKTDN